MLITFKTLQLQSFKIEVSEDDLVCFLQAVFVFENVVKKFCNDGLQF